MATMTAGDCGSKDLGRKEISAIRKKEASNSAKILDAQYDCLNFEDLFITYDKASVIRVIAQIRKVRPDVVITMSPTCYMVDHEMTSKLVQTACFGGGFVNVNTTGFPPLEYIPHLYYADPMEGKDKFGVKIQATTIVGISKVIDIKTLRLDCEKSFASGFKKEFSVTPSDFL